jgi:hypothetical protein
MSESACDCSAGFRIVPYSEGGYVWRRCKCQLGIAAPREEAPKVEVFADPKPHLIQSGHHNPKTPDGAGVRGIR